MNKVYLNGANPEAIAELMGGTLLLHHINKDLALIAGGDITKLPETVVVA